MLSYVGTVISFFVHHTSIYEASSTRSSMLRQPKQGNETSNATISVLVFIFLNRRSLIREEAMSVKALNED